MLTMSVMQGLTGFLAGVAAGIVMGVVSDIAARLGLFRSSLFVVDGNFLLRSLGIQSNPHAVYLAGIPMHLATSGVFGAFYTAAASFAGLQTFSTWLTAFYVFLLWLAMLFIALPLAGQGFFGNKAGRSTWLEQLALHVVFFAVYYGMLRVIYPALPAFSQAIR